MKDFPFKAPVGSRDKCILSPPMVEVRLCSSDPGIWVLRGDQLPTGSIKDLPAVHMLHQAWLRGEIGPGDTVVEASSGSTSVSLAYVCAQIHLTFRGFLPEDSSRERKELIRAYAGKVHLSPKEQGIGGAMVMADQWAQEHSGYPTHQFSNPDNPAAYFPVAKEIVHRVPNGDVQAVVAGVGTGGTLVGLTRGLTECGYKVIPFAARPVAEGEHSTRIPGVVEGKSAFIREGALPGLGQVNIEEQAALHSVFA